MTLAAQLETIESSGLIRLAQEDPELEYIFRHALVQDATYESLLRADRRILHQAVGRTLATLYADRLDEVASTLALHFEKADEWGTAVDYYIRAGEAAARVYAMDEAIAFFSRAIEIFPPSTSTENLTHLYSQYGRMLELAGRFDSVIKVYEQMRAEGVKRQDLRMELDALMSQAILHSTPSPYQSFVIANELCKRALSIANTLQYHDAQSRIYWILMIANLFDGHLKESVLYGEQSLEIARMLNNPERLAFILNDITRCYASNGLLDKGLAANLEARVLWKELGNLPMLVDNLVTWAEYLFFGGEYLQAIAVAHEAYEMAKSIHNIWGQTFCLMILGFAYAEIGEIDKSIQANYELLSFDPRQTFAIAQIASHSQLADIYTAFGAFEAGYQHILTAVEKVNGLESKVQASALAGLIRHKLSRGDTADIESLFEKAIDNYDPENFTTFAPQYIERARNDLLMYKGAFQAAAEALDQTLLILDQLQIVFCRPEFMFRKANALIALGRRADALTILYNAATLGERTGACNILWRIYARISELQNAFNDLDKADQARRKAKMHISFLADHVPVDLRQSFLKLPEVVKLFEE